MLLAGLLLGPSLCAACGPEVHPATTQAIIEVESAGNPLAIHDNVTNRAYSPRTRDEAVATARNLLAQEHSIDMGLMQINSQHLRKKRIDYERLFDPCFNIKTGTGILASFYRLHRRNSPSDPQDLVLLKSLSSYNTGTPYGGSYYVGRILKRAGVRAASLLFAPREASPPGHGTRAMAFFRKEATR